MGKTLVVAVFGISVIGGFVALEAQQRVLSPEEQIARYRANERARDIAHLGLLQGEKLMRERLVERSILLQRVVTGRSDGGAYRCSIAVENENPLTASLDVVSTYNGATHQINTTLVASADTQLTRRKYQEWYTAQHFPKEW